MNFIKEHYLSFLGLILVTGVIAKIYSKVDENMTYKKVSLVEYNQLDIGNADVYVRMTLK